MQQITPSAARIMPPSPDINIRVKAARTVGIESARGGQDSQTYLARVKMKKEISNGFLLVGIVLHGEDGVNGAVELLVLPQAAGGVLRPALHHLLLPRRLPEHVLLLPHLLLAALEETVEVGVREEVVRLLLRLQLAFLLLLATRCSSHLQRPRVLLSQQLLTLRLADRLVHLPLALVVFHLLPPAAGRLTLDVLRPHYFLEALLMPRPVVALAAVELGDLGGGGLLAALGGALLLALALLVGLALLGAAVLILIDLEVELEEEGLVGLLELLDVGLGVLEQVHLLALELLQLCLERLRVELELVLDLGRDGRTPMRLRTSVSPRCSSCSSLPYSSSRLRCRMNSARMPSSAFRQLYRLPAPSSLVTRSGKARHGASLQMERILSKIFMIVIYPILSLQFNLPPPIAPSAIALPGKQESLTFTPVLRRLHGKAKYSQLCLTSKNGFFLKGLALVSFICGQTQPLDLRASYAMILICELYMDNISAGSFIKQQIEFDCPLCSESYDDGQRFPMMLCSSQHSCCLNCVNSIIFKKLDQEADCPFCKARIAKKQVKKFRLLHEIKATAGKLQNKHANGEAEQGKSSQQVELELKKEREKNAWLIQQMQERDDMWVRKLKNDSHEEDRMKTELMMRRFEVEHLRAVIHEQNERLSLQRIKESSLLNQNIKMKLHPCKEHPSKEEHLHFRPRLTFKDFQVIKTLGKGDYSTVYLAREKRLGFLCALKAIDKWKVRQFGIEQIVIAEIKATSYLDHPNITKVYGYFWDEKLVYTIGEYAVEESLAKFLRKNPKGSLSGIVRQVALAVQELVTHSIVHNEINCNDVILTFKDVVKLSGFSWVSFVSKGSADLEGYFKDIRAIAPICYQIMHPQKAIKDYKSSLIRNEIEDEIKKPDGDKNVLNFIELVLSKCQNPLHLLERILSHPFLNDK